MPSGTLDVTASYFTRRRTSNVEQQSTREHDRDVAIAPRKYHRDGSPSQDLMQGDEKTTARLHRRHDPTHRQARQLFQRHTFEPKQLIGYAGRAMAATRLDLGRR